MSNVFRISGNVRKWRTLGCTALLLVLMVGCGGGGGGPLQTKLRPDTIIVPDTVDATLQNDLLTLTGPVPDGVKQGSVLVVGKAPGLLRKVKAVRTSRGDQVEIETEQATLEDAFEQLETRGTKNVRPEDWTVTDLAEGVSVEPYTPEQQASRGSVQAPPLRLRLTNVKLLDLPGGAWIVLDGILELQFGVDYDLRIEADGVKRFMFVPVVRLSPDLIVRANKPFQIPAREIDLGGLTHPFLLSVWPPVWLENSVRLIIRIDGTVDAGMKLHCDGESRARIGAEFDTGVWRPVLEATNDTRVSWDGYARARINVYPATKVQGKLYSVLGPFCEAHVPKLMVRGEITGDGLSDPIPFFDLDVAAGAEATIGVEGNILGSQLANYLLSRATIIAETSLPGFPKRIRLGGTGEVVVRSPKEAETRAASDKPRRVR